MPDVAMTVNGTAVRGACESSTLLSAFLRETLKLTGTHVGCDTSQCGACTVIVDGRSIKSCTMLALEADGATVKTIEGVARADGTLHPVQEAFRNHHALQCGFCTPGMVMASVALLERNPQLTEAQVRHGLEGNLCRCTGYQNIVDAVLSASQSKAGRKMDDFKFHRAKTLADAAAVFGRASEARYLAGGQTLLPVMKQGLAAPSDVISLAHVDGLAGITVAKDLVTIGAMTRHADVAAHAGVRAAIPALAVLAGGIGDPHVRNRGTIGGSLANSDPAADYPAAVLGLGATVVTDERTIGADHFFEGLFQTALQPGELVTRVEFPVPQRAGYVKFPHPASRYALVGVMVSQGAHGVRVAVTGAGACAFRVAAMEQALAKSFTPEALASVTVADGDLTSDRHGSAEYRAHLIGVLAKRAVAFALNGQHGNGGAA